MSQEMKVKRMTEQELNVYMRKTGERFGLGRRNIDVREVFKETDEQLWYDIEYFPGYQLSNKGYVRSFKLKGKHPFGTIVVPKITENGKMFTIKDRNNLNKSVTLEELQSIVESNKEELVPNYTYEDHSYVPLCKRYGDKSLCEDNGDTYEMGNIRATNEKQHKEVHRRYTRTIEEVGEPVFVDEEGRKYYPLIPGEPAMRLEREIIKPISFINRY